MIKVKGTFKLVGDFEVELDMTEEEFDNLSYKKQDQLLDSGIDWYYATRNSEVDEIEVEEVEKIEGNEENE